MCVGFTNGCPNQASVWLDRCGCKRGAMDGRGGRFLEVFYRVAVFFFHTCFRTGSRPKEGCLFGMRTSDLRPICSNLLAECIAGGPTGLLHKWLANSYLMLATFPRFLIDCFGSFFLQGNAVRRRDSPHSLRLQMFIRSQWAWFPRFWMVSWIFATSV